MSKQTASTDTEIQPPRERRRLWLWFMIGFAVIFFAMALVWPMHFYDGRTARQAWLWQYYLLEIQLALNSSGNLGPKSGNVSAALGVALTHVVISTVGGAVNAWIGWATQKKLPAV
jgi:hypothetical protein